MNAKQLSPTAGLVILALGVVSTATAQQTDPSVIDHETSAYVVTDGQVDRSTFLGWRVFHSSCHICHGVDTIGTTVAPDLT